MTRTRHADPMAEVPDRLTTALERRYVVERKLGSGGMASVYLAEDVKHHRKVAVKVLRPEIAAMIGSDRFLREIRFVAGLTHPHILPLHDSGDADGFLYYVMPVVEGGTLCGPIDRDEQLPIGTAVRIAREVASALDYAHRHDVVHRDIKPGNILLHDGAALVSDFGIGKALSTPDVISLTLPGMSIGTPEYMSPEQASGDMQIDGRSDLYSLACVLYETLAGEPPFTGPNVRAIITQRFVDVPERVSTKREGIPAILDDIVAKALATESTDRFATCAEFAEALSFIEASTSGSYIPHGLVAEQRSSKSIAVLPFANMSSDPANEYFSDGITEEIVNTLSKLQDLQVASHTSSIAFKGHSLERKEIAARLNVGTVLEGSVRQDGNRLRITAQLIDTATDSHLWSEQYDSDLGDVFAVQGEIATAIAKGLKVTLAAGELDTLVKPPTDNLDAYHLYLKGRHFWNLRGTRLKDALECFEQACQLDPRFAPALAGLADTYCILGAWGYVPALVVHAKARSAAERVLEIDPTLPDGHQSLGIYHYYFGHDLTVAERELRMAMQLNPRNGWPPAFLAQMFGLIGRTEEAVALAARAQHLEPFSPWVHMTASFAYTASRKPALGVEGAKRALAVEEEFAPAYWAGGWSLSEAGKLEEGCEWLEKSVSLLKRAPFPLTTLAATYLLSRRPKDAEPLIRELEAGVEQGAVDEVYLAWINLIRGNVDIAREQLALALRDGQVLAWASGSLPSLEWLYYDEQWCALLHEAGLGRIVEVNRRRFPDAKRPK